MLTQTKIRAATEVGSSTVICSDIVRDSFISVAERERKYIFFYITHRQLLTHFYEDASIVRKSSRLSRSTVSSPQSEATCQYPIY